MVMEIFLTSFIQVLFEKLLSRDLWDFAKRERIHTLLMKWSRMLEEIGAVLADAEEKQMTDRWEVKLWLEDLEDLAYDLDDVLDEFATEALRQKVMVEPQARTSKVRAFVPSCFTSFNPGTLVSDFRMRSQINDITTRLNDLFDRRARLGLHIVDAGPSAKAPQRPPTSSLVHEPCLYGRNGDKTKVLETLILRDCKNLSKLPLYTSNLINLRHLDVTGAISLQEMPPNIGKLTSLQTLSNFIVGKDIGSMINQLGNLTHLRGTLCISGLETVMNALDAKRAKLKDKQGLDELSLSWSNNSENSSNGSADSEILDMLEPHKKLKVLTFSGYHGLKFPTWVGNSLFSNMVSLKFQNCNKCTSFAPLGQLPSLGTLQIAGLQAVENVGLEFYGSGCSNPFPTLWRLTFEDMPKWKYWSPFEVEEEAQAFSHLQQLSIKRCPKLLGKLPSNLPCLRNLDIEECPQLVVALIPSPKELIEVRNTLYFGSLISLSLENVSVLASYGNPQEGNEAEKENAMYSHLSSLTSLSVQNIQEEEEEEEEEGLQQQKQNEELPYIMMLEYLKIEGCKKLEKLPRGLHNLKSLRELIINNCPCLISFPKTGLPSTLRTLRIGKCVALQSLPRLMMLNCLEKLQVWKCPSLTYLSCSRTGLPPSLKQLDIWHCENLKSLIAEVGMKINCPSLESVEIWQCKSLKSLPDVMQNDYNGGCLRSLSKLWISGCDNVESIPEEWFITTNLRELYIKWCKRLKGLPHHAYNNNHLTSLQISIVGMGSKSLSVGGLHRLSSLRRLYLEDYGGASFPPEEEDDRMMLWLPPSLIQLYIQDFPNMEKLSCKDLQNVPSLEELRVSRCPKLTIITELGQLPSLSELWIKGCPNLATFSVKGQGGLLLPPSLLYLRIDECPILKQQCELMKKGHYWPLIYNIPHVEIDGRFVFDTPQSWDAEMISHSADTVLALIAGSLTWSYSDCLALNLSAELSVCSIRWLTCTVFASMLL
ncbi:hypothetical protein RHSIM_Rhsim07G0110200 [Rhododendron simsii]|uniref:Rx N-terminal domain-containing protein n=1 Tax=Rhododendron simsii TaxID=118357 RepID=A0A834GPY6_RHOSS|nr:hypothetical protein RHSIM_Rhsim07G0110200 [Rhododendron simsii]